MEEIIKVAENNVEVRTIYFKDKKGVEPVVISVQSYGEDRIAKERLALDNECVYWDNVDIKVQKNEIMAKLKKLDLIEAELNKNAIHKTNSNNLPDNTRDEGP